MLLPMASSTVFAEEVEINGLWYNLSETTAEVIQYKNNIKYSGDIVIPTTVSYNDKEYSVTSIGEEAFYSCVDLTSVTIPNSVSNIGQSAFGDRTGLTDIIVDIDNESYSSENGVLFNKDKTALIQYPHAKSGTEYVIPNSVATIGMGAFFDCTSLTSISIPNSVTSIGGWAFSLCTGLTTINVEDGNAKYDSRDNCNAIIETETNTLIRGCKNTVIPNSVTSIGSSAFCECSGLTSITIGNSVRYIGSKAFYNCGDLESVTIPNSVRQIGERAFGGCHKLMDVISLIQSPAAIPDNAFSESTYLLGSLYVPGGTMARYMVRDGWKNFTYMEETDLPTGISNVSTDVQEVPGIPSTANGLVNHIAV